jgi:hypothetical protein
MSDGHGIADVPVNPHPTIPDAWGVWCKCGWGATCDSPEAAVIGLAWHLNGGDSAPPDLVGPVEIADLLGVQRDTVHKWRHRKLLPEPLVILSGTPIWEWDVILRWAEDRKSVTPSG